jgi:hypothetical protein
VPPGSTVRDELPVPRLAFQGVVGAGLIAAGVGFEFPAIAAIAIGAGLLSFYRALLAARWETEQNAQLLVTTAWTSDDLYRR